MIKKVKTSAPGKIILSGEHAVVYGYPEILSAIDRRLSVEIYSSSSSLQLSSEIVNSKTFVCNANSSYLNMEETDSGLDVQPVEGKPIVEYAIEIIKSKLGVNGLKNLKVRIFSQIPIGCGIGSSAAFAVAITAAFFEFLKLPRSLKKINEIAYEIEKKQHGTPSGGDNTVSTYGGFLLYRKETETIKVFSPLKTNVFPSIFLINSGKPKESTGEMIKTVKDFLLRSPQEVEKIFKEMEQITRNFLRFLSGEELDFGSLITRNERLLEQLGVVSSQTMKLIQKIELNGGSAKISGAGGLKENSGIVLAYHQDPNILLKLAKEEKLDMFKVKLGERGVRSEKNS